MPKVAHCKRIQALLVALLYLYFSTVVAVGHTHVSVNQETNAPAQPADAASVTASVHCPAPYCAACDWQVQCVTLLTPPPPAPVTLSFGLTPSLRTFSFYPTYLARFSSRAPPLA